jgi:CubicO group peptidase (beta-lactamase class C family)
MPKRPSVLRFLCFGLLALLIYPSTLAQQVAERVVQRQQFQVKEIIPSKFGGWIFSMGSTPRLIWRDVDEMRRLGMEATFRVRWFDGNLAEAAEPNHSGRWMVLVEGQAPNGTPLRRSFTFFALPEKLDPEAGPDLTIKFPNFPGPKTPAAWTEHQSEFDRLGRDFLMRGLLEGEMGAILFAGLAESKPIGRPKKYSESTSVVNDQYQLALKLKVFGHDIGRGLQLPRIRKTPAQVLHAASHPTESSKAVKAAIDDYCRAWAEATREPFVTMVARHGEIVTHEAFGSLPSGEPIDLEYRCWIASLTKTVTAILFSQFVDQGLIALDDQLSSVFPDYPANDPHVPTFRQCLNHTSGLTDHGELGGMKNPNLENIVLNGIDVNQPLKVHQYGGLGFELVAKAMEMKSGKCAMRIYDEHLFRPLDFGDVVMGNASSDGEFTASELAVLGQWLANRGSYGELEFISPQTFEELLPKPLKVDGATQDQGLGLHWIRHLKRNAPPNSSRAEDFLFSRNTIGHGSFSGCILVVDLDQNLVIAQARKKFTDADSEWYARFFQTVAAALVNEPLPDRPKAASPKN